nr:Retrovirus-related Pol polyprotein from transposon TNT 1-94 [Ipomoea batatas]
MIDSGCANHMTNDREHFKELDKTTISKLIEKGFKVLFEGQWCLIKYVQSNDVFKVKMREKSFALNLMEEEQHHILWHKRLWHFHHAGLIHMQKHNLVRGVTLLEDKLADCVACQYGKQVKQSFLKSARRVTHKLQLVYTDVCGPMRTPTLNDSKYYIAFIDDYTRYCSIYFVKFKSKIANIFWRYKTWVENQSGCRIQIIRSDNGNEYANDMFGKFCEEARIEHQFTAPYTSHQNGVKRDKLDKKVESDLFIGYSNTSKAYRIFQPQNGKCMISRDVKFMEDKRWNWEVIK